MNPFEKPTPAYAAQGELPSPYDRARQEWDSRIGSARAQARNWQRMAFGCLALSFALAGGLAWQATRATVHPYIVEVDPTGGIRRVSLPENAYRLTDAQVASQLIAFVNKVRSKSTDPIIVRQNWLNAYKVITAKAKATLDGYAQVEKPFDDVGKVAKTVDISSVVKVSDSTFQVRWKETTFRQGVMAGTDQFLGSFEILQRPPKTDRDMFDNPLGFYVDALNWSREFVSPTVPQQSAGTP
jgi:type IV secretion system protein VirB5